VIKLEVELATSHHLIDEERLGVCIEICGDGGRLCLILQPDQGDVVVLNESAGTGRAIVGGCDGKGGRIGRGIRESGHKVSKVAGLATLHWTDWGLAGVGVDG